MKTYRINKEELENKKVLAEGYKIFSQGFKTKNGNYSYADENGNVKGTFHRVDGDISACEWGLHFSENPFDCFNFYECVQWNEFAKVRAYEKIIDEKNKVIAQVLEIVETYTFEEFINILREYNKSIYVSNNSEGINDSEGINNSGGINRSGGINYSRGVNYSDGINYSRGVNYSDGINHSEGINYSRGVNYSYGINRSDGIDNSEGINYSYGINRSEGINNSGGINRSEGINYSRGVNRSGGVNRSEGINYSEGINNSYGINYSCGVNRSYGILKCAGISESIFCFDASGKFKIFNKEVKEERFKEVMSSIKEFNWYPVFNNAFELSKEKEQWFEVNIPGIFEIDNRTAWSTMPQEMKEYIQSLPEYNEEIFNKIIGDLDND